MSKNFRETLNQQLQNPEFKAEWDALEPEFQIIKAMIDGRKEKNITQKELADITGITQADISRIETGNSNPSIQTLQRLAAGLGMRIKLEFIPLSPNKQKTAYKPFFHSRYKTLPKTKIYLILM